MNATKTLIGMAAALALSTGTTVLAQVGGPNPETISPPVPSESNDKSNPGADRGTTGQPGNHSGMNTAASNASSDQSVQQQLQQIQSSPDQAPQKLFILHQGMMNAWEIQLSDAVASKTQNQEIKQLAQMTKQDHQKAQDRLQKVAQKHNVSLPDTLPAMKQQELEVVKQLPAEKLDMYFLAMQKAGHAAAITSLSDCQQMFKGGQNQELSQYIDQTLPTVKQHANRIVEVAQANGLTGDLTTIASSGSSNDSRDNSAAQGTNPKPPKARDGALRDKPGDQMTGEQRE